MQRQKNVTDTLGERSKRRGGKQTQQSEVGKNYNDLFCIFFFGGGGVEQTHVETRTRARGKAEKKNKTKQKCQYKKKAVNKSRGGKKRITRIFDNKDGMEQPYLSCYAPREGSKDEQ